MKPLRIAHISDLHFASPTFSPTQFFSKRWIGNLNQFFSRSKIFAPSQLERLPDLFRECQIDTVLITGDLTTTGLPQEFRRAEAFIDRLKKSGLNVVAIPGNHDHYTKSAYRKKLFYQYFPEHRENGFSLKEEGVALIPIHEDWMLVALDTTLATSLTSSQGCFDPKIEHAMKKALASIPAKMNVIVINHFPLFEQERPNKTLLRAGHLRSLIASYPNIRFYLHGHTHTHCIADLRASNYPILLDSGSAADRTIGTWHYLELTKDGVSIHVHRLAGDNKPALHSFQWGKK